jgi:hypothetical protein
MEFKGMAPIANSGRLKVGAMLIRNRSAEDAVSRAGDNAQAIVRFGCVPDPAPYEGRRPQVDSALKFEP